MTTLLTAGGERLTLGPELARGGEGIVLRVRERPGQVAKCYHPAPPARAAEKLEAMLARRPADPTAARLGHTSIAWPTEVLLDEKGRFAGFLMPGIFDGRPLVDVYNRKRRAQILPGFDRRYLHRTAANFAAAVGALHAHGLVVGDLNESNVLVRPNALVTLIDTDSYQVPNLRGRQPLIFPCPVGKTEFTPPELQGRPFAGAVRTPEHDRFALAVLIFQLLMEGSHPFRARWLGQGDPPSTEQKISQGLFPHGQPAMPLLQPPPGLPSLDVLHPNLAELVRRCFTDGHTDPTLRPTPAEWERALGVAERALVRCHHGHWYDGHLRRCPWCDGTGDGPPVGRRIIAEPQVLDRAPVHPVVSAASSPVSQPTFSPRRRRGFTVLSLVIVATLVISLLTPLVYYIGLPLLDSDSDPTPRAPSTLFDSFDLETGDVVRLVGQPGSPESFVFQAPDPQSQIVGVLPNESFVRIAGEAVRRDGQVWWPIHDLSTDIKGFVLEDFLEPVEVRG